MNAILACLLSVSAVDVDITTLAEDQVSGTLAEVTTDSVVVVTASGKATYSAHDLLAVKPQTPMREALESPVTVRLVDGSVLRADGYQVADSTAMIALAGGGQVQTGTQAIHSVLFRQHSDSPSLAQQWDDLQAQELLGDTIVIRKEDPEVTLKALEGVLFDITPDTVNFKYAGRLVPVRREKVEGVLYFHPLRERLPDAVCRVIDVDGSIWNAKILHSNNDALGIVTVSGAAFNLPLDRVAKLDYSVGKIVYLSDLTPESVSWSPFVESPATADTLQQIYHPQMDQSFSGGTLRLFSATGFSDDGITTEYTKQFDKGLAVHSRTLLTYRLPDRYSRFLAKAGIDPQVRDAGNLRLVISGDGKTLFEGTVTGTDPQPLDLDVDITGVRRLRILVDFGDELDISDYLHLCNAKVTK